ncbi:MAG: hypothetical protein AAB504_03005 [Patescibacteria group bacterium]
MKEKIFGAQGTPEQIKKAEEENLTGEQAEKDKIRKEAYDAGREKGLKEAYYDTREGKGEARKILLQKITPEALQKLENILGKIEDEDKQLYYNVIEHGDLALDHLSLNKFSDVLDILFTAGIEMNEFSLHESMEDFNDFEDSGFKKALDLIAEKYPNATIDLYGYSWVRSNSTKIIDYVIGLGLKYRYH